MHMSLPPIPARLHSYARRKAGAASAALVCLALASPAHAAQANAPDISGVWWASSYSPKIQLVDGGQLPFTPAGKAQYDKNMAGLKDGSIKDEARRICVPDGVPRILATPYPFEIVQTPNRGEVHILYELNHVIRQVPIDKPMPPADELELFPFYSGHSAGHFEGDTLVIETAGFNEKTYLDNSGAPHTDQLRTTERIRKIGANELENVVTIHDPGVFTKDWSARFVYSARNDIRMMDYNCGEKHRDLSSVKGVQPR